MTDEASSDHNVVQIMAEYSLRLIYEFINNQLFAMFGKTYEFNITECKVNSLKLTPYYTIDGHNITITHSVSILYDSTELFDDDLCYTHWEVQ